MSGITGTSTTLSGLEQDTRYYIWVAAFSPDGQGPYSTIVSKTTYTGIIYTLYLCGQYLKCSMYVCRKKHSLVFMLGCVLFSSRCSH